MADITDPAQSPSVQDDSLATGNGNGVQENRGIKRQRLSTAGDDDDDDDDKPGRERRKIDIKFIQDKSRRHITFSKRKAGIMKKVRLQKDPSVAHEPLYRLQMFEILSLTESRLIRRVWVRHTSCQF